MKVSYSHFISRTRRHSSGGSFATFVITLITAFLQSHFAMAVPATSFGDMLCSSINNGTGPLPDLMAAAGYIAGTAFIAQGLQMLIKHSENPHGQPLHQPITRMGGGALLLAMPSTATAIINTLFKVPVGGGIGACAAGPIVAGPADLSTLLTNMVNNLKDPFTNLTSDAAIVMGTFMVLRGLIKASKYGMDPREHSMTKILANLIVGAVLMVAGQSFTYMFDTLFGLGAGLTSFTAVTAWPIMGAGFLNASPQFIQAVQSAGIFMEIVGMIAFIRGWLIIKSASTGEGQATLAQGITHMLGGVLSMNIFGFLQLMDATFGTGFL